MRVLKVGGSLFDLPDLQTRLTNWLERNAAQKNVFIAGGGALVDAIRNLDRMHGIGNRTSHRMSLQAMKVTAELLSGLLPDCELVQCEAAAIQSIAQNIVFDAHDWVLEQVELPQSWDFTSDSIAAHLATKINASELVLMKSVEATDENAETIVDRNFRDYSSSIPKISFINLRR